MSSSPHATEEGSDAHVDVAFAPPQSIDVGCSGIVVVSDSTRAVKDVDRSISEKYFDSRSRRADEVSGFGTAAVLVIVRKRAWYCARRSSSAS